KGKAELKKVSASNLGLTLPYHPNASYLKIRNQKEEIIEMISLKNIESHNNIIDRKEIHGDEIEDKKGHSLIYPLLINKVFAANGTLNIAIIGDNYNGDNLHFQNDVNGIAAGLLSIEPFKSYISNIVFYPQLSTAQICSFTTSLTCNDTVALQQASSTPYDKIYVLYNGPYAGFAYLGTNLAYGSNASNMPVSIKKALFIHELVGHALGGLMDEYSYGTTGASYAPNCSPSSSCPSWSSILGLGCFSTCGFTNLYRATDNSSVMNTALLSGTLTFDSFSKHVVNGKLLSFLGASPPTPTLPPPVPTPTITPSLSPTITPSLTPGVTPTITITPTNTTPT
ncbi:MAG: M64 family metallopeptidase, partial [Bacteroidota bacterium]